MQLNTESNRRKVLSNEWIQAETMRRRRHQHIIQEAEVRHDIVLLSRCFPSRHGMAWLVDSRNQAHIHRLRPHITSLIRTLLRPINSSKPALSKAVSWSPIAWTHFHFTLLNIQLPSLSTPLLPITLLVTLAVSLSVHTGVRKNLDSLPGVNHQL